MKQIVLLSIFFTLGLCAQFNQQNGDYRQNQGPRQGNYQQEPKNDYRPREQIPTRPPIPILRFENQDSEDGSYRRFAYETGNNIQAEEQAYFKNEGPQSQGSFAYTGDDGAQYALSYTADENGFQVQGSHLPTPPPVPAEILKAIQQNAEEEARGIFDDGSYRAEHQQGGEYRPEESENRRLNNNANYNNNNNNNQNNYNNNNNQYQSGHRFQAPAKQQGFGGQQNYNQGQGRKY